MSDENITNGSDTGNAASWNSLVSEAVGNGSSDESIIDNNIDLKKIVNLPLHVGMETLLGAGLNPFLKASPLGRLQGPDGVSFDLSVPEACYKWVNIRCQPGSVAEGWGVVKTDAKTDVDFIRELLSYCHAMRAAGPGVFALFIYLSSGTLLDRMKEIFLRFVTDDDKFTSLTCWTKWIGVDPSQLPPKRKSEALADIRLWTAIWQEAAEEAAEELGPLNGEQAIDVASAISRYGAFMKRKRSNASLDVTLIEEAKAFLTLKAHGILIPWTQRNATRTHLAKLHYGNLIVSFVPNLRSSTDIASWDKELQNIRITLSDFEESNDSKPPPTPVPQAQGASVGTKRLNRLQQKHLKDGRYIKKLGGQQLPELAPPSNQNPGPNLPVQVAKPEPQVQSRPSMNCFNCGSGDHLARDCPNPRRSARIANKPPIQNRLGMMGHVEDYEDYQIEEDVDASPQSADDDGDLDEVDDTPWQSAEDPDGPLPEVQGKLGMFAPEVTKTTTNVRSVSLSLNGKPVKFGLDGGLDVSLISRQSISKLNLNVGQIKPCNIMLSGLGGSLRINQMAECEFNFGVHYCGLTDSLPGDFDGLLGIDLLEQLDIPAVVDFKRAYERLQKRLQGERDPEPQTWTPMFTFVDGPLSEQDLRECVADLNLPIMDCEFDSPYPIIRERGRPTPFVWREKVDQLVRKLEDDGVLKEVDPHSFGWVSPAVFIPKHGTDNEFKLRFVVDYSSVNQRVVQTSVGTYPHSSNAFLSEVRRDAKYFAKIDIANAFWNLPISEKIRPFLRTSVITSQGERLFEWLKGPQGFTSTPIWWINFIEEVLRSLNKVLKKQFGRFGIRAFMDDLLIYANDKETCAKIFKAVLQYLTCLGIPFGKLVEACEKVDIIGLTFTSNGVFVAETASFKTLKVPRDKSELRSAVGVFQYIKGGFESKSFVKNMGILTGLLKKSVQFVWTDLAQSAWDYFCNGFERNVYHYFSDREQLESHECFLLQTDASDFGISSVLWICDCDPPNAPTSDWFAAHGKLIATKCRVYSAQESVYPMWDKESLALFEGLVSHQEKILLACDRPGKFWVFSDSSGAIHRFRKVLNGGKLDDTCASSSRARRWKRWIDDMTIILLLGPKFCHIAGSLNSVADYFSRALPQIDGSEVKSLGLSGTIENDSSNSFYSDLLTAVRTLQAREDNDDIYEGKFIRSFLTEESISFQVIDGLLYFCPGPATHPRLYIPPGKAFLGDSEVDIRTALVSLAHQTHEGINRTSNNLNRYYWPKQAQLVKNFISSCLHCQKKNIKKNFGRLTGRSIPNRFDRIIVDHCSPSVVGNNKYGKSFRHVLVVCDSFSRYIELFPVHTTSVEETCECLIKWCLRYGYPRELIADNALSLKNDLINKTLSLASQPSHDLIRWIAPIHYPQSQGEAERVVREIKLYCNTRNDSSWPNMLPFISFAHNTASYGATNLSPYMILHGSEPTRLVDTLSWPLTDNAGSTAEEFTDNLKRCLQEYHDYYRLKMEEYRTRARDYYNDKHVGIDYEIGDKVWVIKQAGFKLLVDGPAEILHARGDHMYDVRISDDETRLLPIQHLCPYVDPNLCPREGIPFAETANEELSQELVKKDPRRLAVNDMVLVRREGDTDNYDYDLGRVIENSPQRETLKLDLYTLRDDSPNRWISSGLQFSYPYRRIFATGFSLTKNSEIRKSTQRQWQAVGLIV